MRGNRSGFTLLELMIAIALMLIVMLMLRTMFVTAQDMYVKASRRVDVFQQARSALDLIEQDLMRMRTSADEDVLGVRSLSPKDFADYEKTRTDRNYTEMNDWTTTDPNESNKIRDLITFTGLATWYDRDKPGYVTGDAIIVYYFRRRLAPDPSRPFPDGAYLVRRVIPVYSNAEIVRIALGEKPNYELRPSEEELCSFVYSARIFADDQAAFQDGINNLAFRFNTMPECIEDPSVPNSNWMWVRTPAVAVTAPPPPLPGGQRALILPKPPENDRVEFGGIWRTNTAQDRNFTSARWNYPSVLMVELTLIDRSFERFDETKGAGTYRSFSRAIQLPASGPMPRLDARDRVVMGR